MSKNYAGLKRIGFSATAAGAVTWYTGKVGAESTINPENTQTETTDGVVYGGSSVTPTVVLTSSTSYDALVTKMRADTEEFINLEYFDGRTVVTDIPTNIMVRELLNPNARDGVSPIEITFVKFHTAPVFIAKP